jgi:hypothetical protein
MVAKVEDVSDFSLSNDRCHGKFLVAKVVLGLESGDDRTLPSWLANNRKV